MSDSERESKEIVERKKCGLRPILQQNIHHHCSPPIYNGLIFPPFILIFVPPKSLAEMEHTNFDPNVPKRKVIWFYLG